MIGYFEQFFSSFLIYMEKNAPFISGREYYIPSIPANVSHMTKHED